LLKGAIIKGTLILCFQEIKSIFEKKNVLNQVYSQEM